MLSRRFLSLIPRQNRQACLSVSNEYTLMYGSPEPVIEGQPFAASSDSSRVTPPHPHSSSPTHSSAASSVSVTSPSQISSFPALHFSPRLYSSGTTAPQQTAPVTSEQHGVDQKPDGGVEMENSSLTPSAVVALLDKVGYVQLTLQCLKTQFPGR